MTDVTEGGGVETKRQRDKDTEEEIGQRERGESFATCRVRDCGEITLCKWQL